MAAECNLILHNYTQGFRIRCTNASYVNFFACYVVLLNFLNINVTL